MLVGIISDTHIPVSASHLPERTFEIFRGVDLILHAGDLVDLVVLEELREIAPVEAVFGNMDPPAVRSALPSRKIVEIEGHRLGLIHGSGNPAGLPNRLLREFSGVSAVIFGHSHRASQDIVEGTLLFNPGSPTDRRFATANSLGRLEIGKKITREIIYL